MPLSICLMGFLILSGCEKAPKFPTRSLWEVDAGNNVCGEYEITEGSKYSARHVKDWPMEKCNGVFGFSTEDIPKVITWAEDMQSYAKRRCK